MPRYKPVDRSPRFLPIVLEEQISPGSFEFALDYLVDHELDLSELDKKFKNDETGASAYDPRVMLKIVLLGYSRGLVSSRTIEMACRNQVVFMAISGDSAPSYTHIAKFVRELGEAIKLVFTQVLLVCDRLGLIGKELFAIDGVKLPGNASKERSGTHVELLHRAHRLEKAVERMIVAHREQDEGAEDSIQAKHKRRIEALKKEAEAMRRFVAQTEHKINRKGQVLKGNATDNDSAKMATSKGVIQGYAGQAAVDSKHQVIVAADVVGSGSEQAALLPMIAKSAPLREAHTLITADAGYHSNENIQALKDQAIPALIADNQMRKRDERFKNQGKYKTNPDPLYDKSASGRESIKRFTPQDFTYDPRTNTCLCPAGKAMYSNGSRCQVQGRIHHKFTGTLGNCLPCTLRNQCLRYPDKTQVRQVAIFAKNQPSPYLAVELMKRAIDSQQGRRLYSQRIGTVEPVFANIRHNKRLSRFTLRGLPKVKIQWNLYCLVHNIEKLAGTM